MVFSLISFYNQTPPPAESSFILDFRDIYDILHGDKIPWREGSYSYSAKTEISGYLVELETVGFSENRTEISFKAELQYNKFPSEYFDPFPSPVLGTSHSPQFQLMDKLYDKSSHRRIRGILKFPNLVNKTGDLYLWANSKAYNKLTYNNADFILTCPDDRGNGTMVWGILLVISLGILTLGIVYNPLKSFKNKFLELGKEILEEKNSELDKILQNRTYEELSNDEKRKYDDISRYFNEIKEKLLRD